MLFQLQELVLMKRKSCRPRSETRFKITPLVGAHALQCIYADVRILWFRGAGKQSLLPIVRRNLAVRRPSYCGFCLIETQTGR
jgi:hypothetical protein